MMKDQMEVVRLNKINKFYTTNSHSFHALKDISLSISKRDFVSIMGRSGSGKTTLLNILGCISTASSGEYYVGGKRVDTLNRKAVAKIRNREIGFIFQNFNLIPNYNLFYNVELPLTYAMIGKKERKKLVMDVLSKVGLSGKERSIPNQISGGERQRVAIARALVNKPSLLLADEPTGNLDSKTGEEILNIFKNLNKEGSTIVLVTHDANIAGYASRSFFLKDGELTGQ